MAVINAPPINAVDSQDSGMRVVNVNEGWRNFFNSVFTVCSALTGSGTTAQRPTRPLWVGRTYFDTTVGIPIWWNGSGWIDANGAPA